MLSKDEIIRMAREAGFQVSDTFGVQAGAYPIGEKIERFAALVAAHEREACAKVCESWAKDLVEKSCDSEAFGAERSAAAIRARGE